MLTCHLETWDSYRSEVFPLWEEHYQAVATNKDKMPMDPDEEMFKELEKRGALQITSVRRFGQMIGYCVIVVRPHSHYKSVLCGFEDAYFVSAKASQGLQLGTRYRTLVKDSVRRLAERGVKKVFFHTKSFALLGKVLGSCGMVKSDELWSCWIGD